VYVFDTIEGVRAYGVGKLNRVTVYGASTLDGAKRYGELKFEDAKVYGFDKLSLVTNFGSKSAGRLLDNQAGRTVVTKLDNTIQAADHLVDQYLPEGEQ